MTDLEDKIARLETGLARYRDGYLNEAEFRKLRLEAGISGTGKSAYGIRLHFPQGAVPLADFFFLVEGADRFGSGSLRLSARQGIEVLGVSLDRLGP
ncbi:MAG TPA: hypothetical protein VK465_15525, partial [Fibrobacteria bacterium]|nr:hypothetical protein [Fibrobacteria bacterium]